MSIETYKLPTEQNNPRTVDIDRVDTLTVLRRIHEEDTYAVQAMEEALPALAAIADGVAARLQNGGRSRRVGLLDGETHDGIRGGHGNGGNGCPA